MSGATDLHNEICQNLIIFFRAILGKKEFKVYMEGVKCKIQGEEYYTYPDVFITSNEADKENKYKKQHRKHSQYEYNKLQNNRKKYAIKHRVLKKTVK